MSTPTEHPIAHDLPRLRNRTHVFDGRAHAGTVLAGMLDAFHGGDAIVFGIPAGGIPVASVVARKLYLPLDVAVVSKITPPFNTEVGYGAVAFDGSVRLNDSILSAFRLSEDAIRSGIALTKRKVMHRVARFGAGRLLGELTGRTAVVIDDGVASGFTMRLAASALRKAGAGRIVIAVPTAHGRTLRALADEADDIYCPNIRTGATFAVADAYRQWRDVGEDEAARILREFAARQRPPNQ